jgi:hypothetical protein
MSKTLDNPKPEVPEAAPKAAEDWKPKVAELFYYPIDGKDVMCRRLSEDSRGITMQIVEGDCHDSRAQLIPKEYYGAIKRLDMPGITPPCNCPAPEQLPAITAITTVTPQA